MEQHPHSLNTEKENPNTYFVQKSLDIIEQERLLAQDRITTSQTGGIFPEQENLSSIQRVLDIGCGPGGWIFQAAHQYPTMSFVGIDISKKMIQYAQQEAIQNHLTERTDFHVMDALRMLEFPDQSFDLVNLRFGVSFLRTWDWPKIVSEMLRVATFPHGILRISESDIGGVSSSRALDEYQALIVKAFYKAGHFFEAEPDGLTSHLEQEFKKKGLTPQRKTVVVETRPSTPGFSDFVTDMKLAFKTITPFLVKWGGPSIQYDELYQRVVEELHDPGFFLKMRFHIVWSTAGVQVQKEKREGVFTKDGDSKHPFLTSREIDVIKLVAKGLADETIAEQIGISYNTVRTHMKSIFAKLGCENRTEAVQIAHSYHLLDEER